MAIKNLRVDFVIIVASIISIIYSPLILLLSYLSFTGIPIFGDLPDASIKPETVVLFVIALFFFIFPTYLLIIKKTKGWKKWMEYAVLMMALSPVLSLIAILVKYAL